MNALRPLTLALFCALAGQAFGAQAPERAFDLDAVDLANTQCIREGKGAQASVETLRFVLGYPGEWRPWTGGRVDNGKPLTFHYRIAFKEPVQIGSALGGIGRFRYLKADAPYPGDPDNADHWLDDAVLTGAGDPRLLTLPPGVRTRAVLCTDRRTEWWSQITTWAFYRERLCSATPLAQANAQTEYTLWPAAAPPHTYAARDVIFGGEWQNSGKDKEGNNTTPPVSDIHPVWFVLSWKEPQKVQALALNANIAEARVYTFVGPPGINPTMGTDEEWKWQRDVQMVSGPALGGGVLWFILDKPVSTRGVKLQIRRTQQPDPQVAWIRTFHVLSFLGDAPVPKIPERKPVLSPFTLAYELPEAGYLTMAVDDAQGRRVRNIVANTERQARGGTEHWDLKDEDGRYVEPATYGYKAIFHPPLRLRYEMTAYPNVTSLFPDRAAWLTGHNGPHGWMADHSAPRAVAVAGDRVWFGSPVAESGVSLVECTLDGRKQWGEASFAGFTGVWWLAADDKYVYIGANACNTAAEWKVDPSTEAIWAIDLKTHEQKTVARLEPTSSRKRGSQSMEARDGKIYISVHGEDPWMSNAAKPADVDLDACSPRYKPRRKPKRAYEVVPDPQNDFLRLFRLTGAPSGYGSGHGLTYLESTRGPLMKQHIVLTFRQPVALGSAVLPVPQGVDYKIKLSVLKPDAPLPPSADDKAQWLPVERDPQLAWDCVAFPPQTKTRALRITFYRGEDDIFTEVQEEGGRATGAQPAEGEQEAGGLEDKAWQGRLEGMKLLRRRYRNLFPDAKVRVNSGFVDKTGYWDAQRKEPVSRTSPGIYVMEWAEPQKVRGAAICEIDGEVTELDVFTGPAGAPVNVEGDENWRKVGAYLQARRDMHTGFESANPDARYLDGYVDFGAEHETRAVRLRVVKQWTDHGDRADFGVRPDRGGKELNLTRCKVYGVAPLQYLGGEDPVDPLIAERIEVFDTAQRKVTQEAYLPQPGAIAFGPDGQLYAVSGRKVVRVDMTGGRHADVATDLEDPRALALDPDGNLYVYDHGPERRNIRVYDKAGKMTREICKTGGYKAGPWDPYRLNSVADIDIDREGHLWVVEDNYYPKRIAQFTTGGEFLKEIFGPTRYGGSGVLDPYDKRRLFLDCCEFELDWETGKVRMKNLTTTGPHPGEVPIRIGERTYLVTRPEFAEQQCGAVHLYERDHARMVAAVGLAAAFSPLSDPRVMKDLGNVTLPDKRFVWCDRDGDGEVQASEVRLTPRGNLSGVTTFSRDLGVQGGDLRYAVKEFLPNGAPVYEEQTFPVHGRCVTRLDNGGFFHMTDDRTLENAVFTPDGRKVWSYKTGSSGVQGLFESPPYFDGQVVAQFGIIGHETPHAGELGEFVVIHSNVGAWSIWTADGLFAGDILRNYRRGGESWWSFPEHERGMDLTDLTAGQEHFTGYFCRSFADNKYYIVAGHNHASVVEVQGIEKFKRLNAEVRVTPQDLQRVQEWERTREKEMVYARAPVLDCFRVKGGIKADASGEDWPELEAAQVEAAGRQQAALRIAYDDRFLYLLYTTEWMGPMKNSGEQYDRLFKTGAAVDLQLGLDQQADPERKAPTVGDLRLLMTFARGKYAAVLYRAVVPGAAPGSGWVVTSPVASATFDEVRRLEEVQMAHRDTERGYVFEAAVPLAALGLVPKEGLRLKMDWGVLVADRDGNAVTRRVYWANKATDIIADAPSEARLHPDLWGAIRFHGLQKSDTSARSLVDSGEEKKEPEDERFIEELKEDFK